MSIRDKIIETANALGMSPADLATMISYETAGTFDPTKKGPTTKWGTHRGLIQFGEPQAKQYGVDWNDPVNSQLGANGAVVKYMLASGFRPGMSLEQAYATINAGSPHKLNARDAAAGGAPGSVREKVRDQFGPHRQKALALLGGEFAPQPGQAAPKGRQQAPTGQPGAPPPPSVAAMIGAPQRSPMAILAALGEMQQQPPQEAPDPRQTFAGNYAWARQNGWRV